MCYVADIYIIMFNVVFSLNDKKEKEEKREAKREKNEINDLLIMETRSDKDDNK